MTDSVAPTIDFFEEVSVEEDGNSIYRCISLYLFGIVANMRWLGIVYATLLI